MLLPVDW